MSAPIQQLTEPKQLRKLLQRLEEVPEAKAVLTELVTNSRADTFLIEEALALKKVKENAHMTSILREIEEYMKVGNIEAAIKTAKRVLEVPKPVTSGKPSGK